VPAVIVCSLATVALAVSTAVAPGAAPPEPDRWTADLSAGTPAGVVVSDDGVRLDPAERSDRPERLGLLTLPPHGVPPGTGQVTSVLTADVVAGSTVGVDFRGRTASGWSEWVTDSGGVVTLPEPTSEVQSRLVLTGSATAGPVVHALTLTAQAGERRRAVRNRPVLGYRVFATREGLLGRTTANGHVIDDGDLFVALPSRRALAPRGAGDYSVKVCTARRCAWAPVWDVGPWNTHDDYWNPRERREQWNSLPQGVPQAQMAHLKGFNDGRDQFDREVLNPAGIDLSDAVYHDVLGLDENAWVQVDFLWTGSGPLATVDGDQPVRVRAAPARDAPVIGTAAAGVRLPVACSTGKWLHIGHGQFVAATSVRTPRGTPSCPRPGPAQAVVPALPGVTARLPGLDVTVTGTDDPAAGGDVTVHTR